jgi:phosphoribosylaminoimidazolecarboxamide formyltransferase/IMP cyclohydrolase
MPASYALLSVSDKTGIVDLAKTLHQFGFKILSTGGTAELLTQAQIPVEEIAEFVNFPEIMGGRVKTLHPKIFGGILAREGVDDASMEKHHFSLINLVVVNLYPFEKVISQPNHDFADAIENIDIGGPSLIRAAAKNYQRVTTVVDPDDYPMICESLKTNDGKILEETRLQLAKKAFAFTAGYDACIANYLYRQDMDFPDYLTLSFKKIQDLRHGENPQQKAGLYKDRQGSVHAIAVSQLLQGKPLSFNNIADADAAWEGVRKFDDPTCMIVKHANPCGVASHGHILEAYRNAYRCDPTSAFGGIIACNRLIDDDLANEILNHQFAEVIIAPEFSADAQITFSKKPNLRLLQIDPGPIKNEWDFKKINQGVLIQSMDKLDFSKFEVVTEKKPTTEEMDDCLFAWKVCSMVKSNAIVLAKHQQTIGIGAGQMSRIDSTELAIHKAIHQGFRLQGSVLASDAFFPFKDSIEQALKAGINIFIQPGGSIRDQEVIEAANAGNATMIFTGIRHFKH